MPTTATPALPEFVDRRQPVSVPADTLEKSQGRERRQFTNSHDLLSPEASELAVAIDRYKMQHRRRFINFEEMLTIFKSLGYQKK